MRRLRQRSRIEGNGTCRSAPANGRGGQNRVVVLATVVITVFAAVR
ncbi:hypothetical protein [Streptomyces erythrochromogenes]